MYTVKVADLDLSDHFLPLLLIKRFWVEVKFILFMFTMKADISMLLMVFFNNKDYRKGEG
jgi:hypothetical protein